MGNKPESPNGYDGVQSDPAESLSEVKSLNLLKRVQRFININIGVGIAAGIPLVLHIAEVINLDWRAIWLLLAVEGAEIALLGAAFISLATDSRYKSE